MVDGVLEVLLEHVEGIEERNLFSCLNCFEAWDARKPYISVKYGNEERISNVAQGDKSGRKRKYVWNEKLMFDVEFEGEKNIHVYNKLELHLMDKHHVSDDDFLGETKTYLKDVVLQGVENGKGELASSKYRVVRPDKSYSGAISFSVNFKRKDGLGSEEDIGGCKESQSIHQFED